MMVFAIAYSGALEDASTLFYGETGSDFIESTLEVIHYMLFLVMILAIAEVFMLISIGGVAMMNFEKMNEVCQDEEELKAVLTKAQTLPHISYQSWLFDYCTNYYAWKIHSDRQFVEETAIFYSLRREFIETRNPLPPYEVEPEGSWLKKDFDYAQYQKFYLSRYMTQAVNFTPLTWLGLWVATLFVFAILMLVDGWYLLMACIWIILGWADMLTVYVLQNKCKYILVNLLNPAHLRGDDLLKRKPGDLEGGQVKETKEIGDHESKGPDNEETPLVSSNAADKSADTLTDYNPMSFSEPKDLSQHSSVVRKTIVLAGNKPLWTTAVPDDTEQGLLSWMFYGELQPNKQEFLFWGDGMGRDMNIYILRLHLLLQSIYFAVATCIFIPWMFDNVVIGWAIFYTIVAVLPIPIQFLVVYPTLVVVMSQISSTGLFKDKKTITDVENWQKMETVANFMRAMAKTQVRKKKEKRKGEHVEFDMDDPNTVAQIKEISRMFNHYDPERTG